MSNQYDTGYDLVPGDDPISVDDRIAAAVGNLPLIDDPDPTLPYGRGWDFDFAAGDFRMHGQAPARISGLDHLAVWIEKVLLTARFAHVIYGDEHGIEDASEMIGRQLTPGLLGRYTQHVKDTLTVHDRISDVRDFLFDNDPLTPYLYVTFTVVTSTGEDLTISTNVGAA